MSVTNVDDPAKATKLTKLTILTPYLVISIYLAY